MDGIFFGIGPGTAGEKSEKKKLTKRTLTLFLSFTVERNPVAEDKSHSIWIRCATAGTVFEGPFAKSDELGF